MANLDPYPVQHGGLSSVYRHVDDPPCVLKDMGKLGFLRINGIFYFIIKMK
ncbi:hypothetical protein [Commensalibacter sp. Nvir]|uniref:hypothetical protein n=1 Tax=Commensalibacter sp. Nvir TaxID=3069817 RepID=UPI0030C8C024